MRLLIAMLSTLLLTACLGGANTKLDTMNKRLAAIESSWQVALETAQRWRTEGRLSQSQRDAVTKAVKDWREARDVVNTARALGTDPDLSSLTGILTTLQNVLREVEGLPTSRVPTRHFRSYVVLVAGG